MKYLLFAQAMAVLMYGYGMAMEASEAEPSAEHASQAEVVDEPRVYIKNDTNWELVVNYGQALYGSLQPFQQRIHSRDTTEIPEDPEYFENLMVAPYGDKWQHAQLAAPKNLMDDIKKVMKVNPNRHILVTIRPSQTFSAWLDRQGGLGAFFARAVRPVEKLMTPFEFEYKAVVSVEKHTPPKITLIRDAFPGVLAAIRAGKPLQARYYLDVPADASRDSIDKAYSSLREKAKVRKDLSAINRQIVLRLLELAHNSLVADSELKEASEVLLAEK